MIYRIIYLFCLFFSLFCRFYQTTSRLYQDSPEPGILVYNGPVKKFRVRNGREEEEDLDKNEKNKKKLFYREAIGAAGLLLILAADIFTKLHFVVLFSMAAWVLLELWIIYDYRKNRQQVSIEIVDAETFKRQYENTEIRSYEGRETERRG